MCVDADSGGRYRIEALVADRYLIGASAKQHVSEVREDHIDLTDGLARDDVDFVLAKNAVAVTGRVVDRIGGPIAHALVSLVRGPPVQSRDDGSYELWAPAGAVAVEAEAAGYAPAVEVGIAPGVVDLRLLPESVLEGRVIDRKTRAPIAGVSVHAEPGDAETVSEAEGRFALHGLAPGRYHPKVASGGWIGGSRGPVSIGLMETREVEVEVERAFRVSGRMVTPDSKPCTGAAVIATSELGETTTVPKSDGSFELDTVQPGEHQLRAYCDDVWTEPQPIRVKGDVEGLIIEIPRAARVGGIVVDAAGVPVAEVNVRLQTGDRSRSAYAWSADDGSFEISISWAGDAQIGIGNEEGPSEFEGQPATRVLELGKDAEPVRLVVERRSRVRGRVVTVSGAPVPSALVILGSPIRGWSASTEGEGRFVIDRVERGRHSVRVADRFLGNLEPQPGSETIEVAAPTEEVTVVVEGLEKKITGRVIDASGAPVSEATVAALRGEASDDRWMRAYAGRRGVLTGADGEFEIDQLADARYTVTAERAGLGSGRAKGIAAGAKITITLAQTGALSGRVEMTGGGSPARFQIELRGPDAPVAFGDLLSFSAADGRFQIEQLEPGRYTIGVRSPEGTGSAEATVSTGRETSGIIVHIDSKCSVRGRLIDFDSRRPVGGILVDAQALGPVSASKQSTSEEDGSFQIDGLPVGAVEIAAPAGFALATGTYVNPLRGPIVELTSGGVTEMAPIALKRSSISSGQVPGMLGLVLEWPPSGSGGVVVEHLDPEIAGSGLEVGAVITHVDGVDVTGANAYLVWLLTVVPRGQRVKLKLSDGRIVELTAKLRTL